MSTRIERARSPVPPPPPGRFVSRKKVPRGKTTRSLFAAPSGRSSCHRPGEEELRSEPPSPKAGAESEPGKWDLAVFNSVKPRRLRELHRISFLGAVLDNDQLYSFPDPVLFRCFRIIYFPLLCSCRPPRRPHTPASCFSSVFKPFFSNRSVCINISKRTRER